MLGNATYTLSLGRSSMKASSTMQVPTSNKPNRTPSTIHRSWLMQWGYRLEFGVNSIGFVRCTRDI